MKINTNILSLSAQRHLGNTTRAFARAMERLASGRRINSSRDDPAGLAISNGLEAQRRGLMQSVRNINDANGFLATADGALATQSDILQRIRELSVQAANGTLSDQERSYLNGEAQSLYKEFERITGQTQFNGVNLLDGSFGTKALQVGAGRGENISFKLPDMQTRNVFGTTTTVSPYEIPRVNTMTMGSGAAISQNTYGEYSVDVVDGDYLFNNFGSGAYFDYTSANGTTYNVWYNIDGGGGAPGSANDIAVNISSTATAEDVADATAAALHGNGCTASVGGGGQTVYIFDTTYGAGSIGVVSTPDFGMNTLQIGAAAGGFTIQGNAGSNYYVWFNVNGAMQDPGLTGTGIRVDVSSADSSSTVATKVRAALTSAGFSISGAANQVILTSGSGESFTVSDSSSKPVGGSFSFSSVGGVLSSAPSVTVGNTSLDVRLADFNGDGHLDMFSSELNANTVSLLLGNGNGTFQARTAIATGSGTIMAQAADVNGDGNLDLITANHYSASINVFLGNGNGTFQARTTLTTPNNPRNVLVYDINEDGELDILAATDGEASTSIFLGNGNGTFQARTSVSMGTGASTLAVADFNGDGHGDIVQNDYTNGLVSIRLGNGNGTFQARTTKSVGTNPITIQSADINNDGYMDLLSANYTGGGVGSISVLLGNGNGTFSAQTVVPVGAGPAHVDTADVNGDGNLDILSADTGTSDLSVALGNGDGTFKGRTTLFAGSTARGIAFGDINGDGVNDLVTSAQGTTTAAIYLTNIQRDTSGNPISLATQSEAEDSLEYLDDALAYVNSARTNIGAIQSRLGFAESMAMTTVENISSAKSLLMDADISQEMAEFTRLQVLQEAGITVLSQANLSTQLALKLLQNI